MTATLSVTRRQAVIVDPLGLHLRPAAKLAVLAQAFRSEIAIIAKGVRANGKSVLDLTTLAAECGTTVGIEAHGPDAEEAATALADRIAAGLDDAEDEDGETA